MTHMTPRFLGIFPRGENRVIHSFKSKLFCSFSWNLDLCFLVTVNWKIHSIAIMMISTSCKLRYLPFTTVTSTRPTLMGCKTALHFKNRDILACLHGLPSQILSLSRIFPWVSGGKCAEALQEVHARNKGSQESASFRDGSAEEGAVAEMIWDGYLGVWSLGRVFSYTTLNTSAVSSDIHPTARCITF